MRKLIVTEFLSLDGVMEDPRWTFSYWNDEIAKFKGEESESGDALLLGRVTYEGFAAAWPSRSDAEGGAYFNGVTKYVVTTTLEKAEWNNSHIIRGNVAEEVVRLKQQPGQNIVIHGSATLVQSLMPLNLIDEYRLLVYPVVLGTGKRLFTEGAAATLKLVESKTLGADVQSLIYHPAQTKD